MKCNLCGFHFDPEKFTVVEKDGEKTIAVIPPCCEKFLIPIPIKWEELKEEKD